MIDLGEKFFEPAIINGNIGGTSDDSGSINGLEKMNRVIAYIEDNLSGEIDCDLAERLAHCPADQIARMFAFITGLPISEYIRRRRLTMAAFELLDTDAKVIDVAARYGYESPEAFTRAFKQIHGASPSAVRNRGVQLKAYPRITFHISIKGECVMDYRIENKEAFEMFGVDTLVSTVDDQNFVSVPKFWETCRADGAMDKIRKAAGIDGDTPLHAAMFNCTDTSHSYLIGYFSPDNGVLKDFTVLPIPASMWAVFPTEESGMAKTAQQAAILWKRIFTEWFATSGYELAPDIPEFELHHNKGNGKYLTEIFIPITEKNQ